MKRTKKTSTATTTTSRQPTTTRRDSIIRAITDAHLERVTGGNGTKLAEKPGGCCCGKCC